jgi:lipoprotein-releasing system permease protein
MNLSLKIALRYIFARHSFNFISVITGISLLGITVGVAALIIVMSIFNGFRELTESQIVGFDPHLRIIPQGGPWIDNPMQISESLDSNISVTASSPVIRGRVVAMNQSNLQVFTLNAIDSSDVDFYQGVSRATIYGNFKTKGLPGIIIGAGLADRLSVLPGDTLTLLAPGMIERLIRTFRFHTGKQFVVSGVFLTNLKDYDIRYGFADIRAGRRLFSAPDNSVSTIDIRTTDFKKINEIKNNIAGELPEAASVLSWRDLHRELYEVMQFERLASFAIISLIIIIAVFNVLASLTMTVVEKRSDIGVLKSLGASDKMISRIYLYEGGLIGLMSSLAGGIIGSAVCLGQIHYKWFRVDAAKYIIDSIPVSLHFQDVVIVMLFSFFLALTATIYPARRAAATRAIEAIRSE